MEGLQIFFFWIFLGSCILNHRFQVLKSIVQCLSPFDKRSGVNTSFDDGIVTCQYYRLLGAEFNNHTHNHSPHCAHVGAVTGHRLRRTNMTIMAATITAAIIPTFLWHSQDIPCLVSLSTNRGGEDMAA